MFPKTATRVKQNTPERFNENIHRQTQANIARFGMAGPAAIDKRLCELNAEWDIERYLETMAPTISLIGLYLGANVNRKWLIVPAVVQAFFLQHALQGWCPPLPFLRSMGIRTMEEIEEERVALKAMRGDFKRVPKPVYSMGGSAIPELLEDVER